MHEFSLMADLLRKIEGVARENGNGRVLVVRVRLGALSHITPEHFAEHFKEGVRGTQAEDAELEIVQMTDMEDPEAQEIFLESVEIAA